MVTLTAWEQNHLLGFEIFQRDLRTIDTVKGVRDVSKGRSHALVNYGGLLHKTAVDFQKLSQIFIAGAVIRDAVPVVSKKGTYWASGISIKDNTNPFYLRDLDIDLGMVPARKTNTDCILLNGRSDGGVEPFSSSVKDCILRGAADAAIDCKVNANFLRIDMVGGQLCMKFWRPTTNVFADCSFTVRPGEKFFWIQRPDLRLAFWNCQFIHPDGRVEEMPDRKLIKFRSSGTGMHQLENLTAPPAFLSEPFFAGEGAVAPAVPSPPPHDEIERRTRFAALDRRTGKD